MKMKINLKNTTLNKILKKYIRFRKQMNKKEREAQPLKQCEFCVVHTLTKEANKETNHILQSSVCFVSFGLRECSRDGREADADEDVDE